jgi:hypothetical protein
VKDFVVATDFKIPMTTLKFLTPLRLVVRCC